MHALVGFLPLETVNYDLFNSMPKWLQVVFACFLVFKIFQFFDRIAEGGGRAKATIFDVFEIITGVSIVFIIATLEPVANIARWVNNAIESGMNNAFGSGLTNSALLALVLVAVGFFIWKYMSTDREDQHNRVRWLFWLGVVMVITVTVVPWWNTAAAWWTNNVVRYIWNFVFGFVSG